MENKAYDLKLLGEKLKAQGLDLAEDAVEALARGVFDWIEESAKISPNPFDNMAMILMPQLRKIAFKEIDKIDGKKG